jgi:hypothetical protein
MRVNPYSHGNPIFQLQGTTVSNPAYSSSLSAKPATPAVLDLLRELFKATPLYIFATALKGAQQR